VYFQPDNLLEVEGRLLSTIHEIRQAEPEAALIIGGDFNQKLEEPGNTLRPELERCNMSVCTYQKVSYHRTGMEKGSKIDYFVASNELTLETRTIGMQTSDHNVVMAQITGQNGTWCPRKTANKEMFFSNILNEIKKDHIKFYLRYVW